MCLYVRTRVQKDKSVARAEKLKGHDVLRARIPSKDWMKICSASLGILMKNLIPHIDAALPRAHSCRWMKTYSDAHHYIIACRTKTSIEKWLSCQKFRTADVGKLPKALRVPLLFKVTSSNDQPRFHEWMHFVLGENYDCFVCLRSLSLSLSLEAMRCDILISALTVILTARRAVWCRFIVYTAPKMVQIY